MAKIKIGDSVRLKGNKIHSMTATGYLSKDSVLKHNQTHLRTDLAIDDRVVECTWFTKMGRPHREYFPEDSLEVIPTGVRQEGSS